MHRKWRANLILVCAAMIWGSAFVAQSVGMDYVGPFTFQAARSLLGGLALLPVIVFMNRKRRPDAPVVSRKTLWTAGLACGSCLFVASSLQQIGLLYTSAGKSGFITALYVVLVPCVSFLLGRRPPLTVWLGALLAAIALYLLCVKDGMSVGRGELLTLGCALCFTGHIMVIDHFSDHVDGVKLSCLQFFVCAALAFLCAFLFEKPSPGAVARCWLPVGYAGVLSCGVGYTFQILGQRDTSPTIASLLMSLESVFAVIFGAILLHEKLTGQEYAGCVLMFAAIILAQLPKRKKPSEKIRD